MHTRIAHTQCSASTQHAYQQLQRWQRVTVAQRTQATYLGHYHNTPHTKAALKGLLGLKTQAHCGRPENLRRRLIVGTGCRSALDGTACAPWGPPVLLAAPVSIAQASCQQAHPLRLRTCR